ncbi:metallophosphoesterase [bacterium]|nr:metallophosphoesterase [bacterium]
MNSIALAFAGVLLVLATLSISIAPASAVPLSVRENIHTIWADKTGLDGGFTFIVIGDTREGDKVHLKLLKQAEAYEPLFILNTGDYVSNGYQKEYEHYAGLVQSLRIPILNVVGNHDVAKETAAFDRHIGLRNWYFDYGNCRFISLDNATGGFSRETLDFARKYLHTDKTCFVAFHKPPAYDRWKVHSMDSDGSGGRGGEMMELIASSNVALVFLGHIHLYDEMEIGGVPYVISGGGGAGLYKKYGFGKAEYGFVVVKVGPDGVSHEWIPLEK